MSKKILVTRKTKETDLTLELDIAGSKEANIKTELPFFNHLLTAMAFHGNFYLKIEGTGDIDVDPHHLVEDVGIVLGDALRQTVQQYGPVARFGHSVIPMDDALSEITIDASGRSFCFYKADYPQTFSGSFDMSLVKEFFTALCGKAGITIHAECRRGENSHHMAESLFKALGKAIKQAYMPLKDAKAGSVLSTKGLIES
ncbi:MAG: imidazoleglycerol-phosphate dehydratase HisB [Spirochaetes bacterium]|nr:imidazoleglycerol-phosphate dehydratase HisB [Spirochaetota bacterium]